MIVPILVSLLVIVSIGTIDATNSEEKEYLNGPQYWWNTEQFDLFPLKQEYEHKRYKRSYNSDYANNLIKPIYGYKSYLGCVAIARTATDTWCYDNCLQGFCPKEVCRCSGDVYNSKYIIKNAYGHNYDYGSKYQHLPIYGHKTIYQHTSYGKKYQPTYGHNFGQTKSLQTSNEEQIEPRFEQQTEDF
ncbi:hypothetical protein BLOT_007495 [Blomia tropicalis]|nr:hypothetical protein BLOT_007495 [Blomia tropicalis]